MSSCVDFGVPRRRRAWAHDAHHDRPFPSIQTIWSAAYHPPPPPAAAACRRCSCSPPPLLRVALAPVLEPCCSAPAPLPLPISCCWRCAVTGCLACPHDALRLHRPRRGHSAPPQHLAAAPDAGDPPTPRTWQNDRNADKPPLVFKALKLANPLGPPTSICQPGCVFVGACCADLRVVLIWGSGGTRRRRRPTRSCSRRGRSRRSAALGTCEQHPSQTLQSSPGDM